MECQEVIDDIGDVVAVADAVFNAVATVAAWAVVNVTPAFGYS